MNNCYSLANNSYVVIYRIIQKENLSSPCYIEHSDNILRPQLHLSATQIISLYPRISLFIYFLTELNPTDPDGTWNVLFETPQSVILTIHLNKMSHLKWPLASLFFPISSLIFRRKKCSIPNKTVYKSILSFILWICQAVRIIWIQ